MYDIDLKIDIESLRTLFDSYHTVTGMQIEVCLMNGSCVYSYPETPTRSFHFQEHNTAIVPIYCNDVPIASLTTYPITPMDIEGEFQQKSSEAFLQILNVFAAYIQQNSLVVPQRPPLSSSLRMYLQTYFSHPITLADMADAMKVSIAQLCRVIRAECESTPHAMLTDIRMRKAMQLLEQTAMPVREIASHIGIDNYNYFSRIFRLTVGASPSEYRKKAQQKPKASFQ